MRRLALLSALLDSLLLLLADEGEAAFSDAANLCFRELYVVLFYADLLVSYVTSADRAWALLHEEDGSASTPVHVRLPSSGAWWRTGGRLSVEEMKKDTMKKQLEGIEDIFQCRLTLLDGKVDGMMCWAKEISSNGMEKETIFFNATQGKGSRN
jgi:hypothetical protein